MQGYIKGTKKKQENMTFVVEEEYKVKIIMENTSIFDVFSEEKIKDMLDSIQIDEKDRLMHTDDSSAMTHHHAKDNILKDINAEVDAIKYSVYASELNLSEFLEEFEGYVDVADGFAELDEYINKVKSMPLLIK